MRKSHLIVSVLLVYSYSFDRAGKANKDRNRKKYTIWIDTLVPGMRLHVCQQARNGLVEVTSTLKKVGRNKYMLYFLRLQGIA